MKYFHTLGCFPTGLETPMRLQEFRETYLQEHVPAEVHEWLACFTRRPAEAIHINVAASLAAMEAIPLPRQTLHRVALPAASLLATVQPVQLALADVGIDVPAFAVRCAVARPASRARLADALSEWNDEVQRGGSTPHRRLAARQALIDAGVPEPDSGDEPPAGTPQLLELDGNLAPQASVDVNVPYLTPQGIDAVKAAMALPRDTAPDERRLLEAVTVLADAAFREARFDLAEKLMREGLRHAHDEHMEGHARANYASALNGCGRYREAEAEAREAVLLSRRPSAYANWAVAVAYLDDFDAAAGIVAEGLEACPNDPGLEQLSDRLAREMAGRTVVPEHARGLRSHSLQAQRDGTVSGVGKVMGAGIEGGYVRADHTGRPLLGSLDPTERSSNHWSRRAEIRSSAKMPGTVL